MSPLPATRTIHQRWSEHHQSVIRGTISGRMAVSTPSSDSGGWDPVTGPSPGGEGEPLFSKPFRAQEISDSLQPSDAAGQPVSVRVYQVTFSAEVGEVPVGSTAKVEECPDDPALVGKRLDVVSTTLSSHRFERTCRMTLDLSNQEVV